MKNIQYEKAAPIPEAAQHIYSSINDAALSILILLEIVAPFLWNIPT